MSDVAITIGVLVGAFLLGAAIIYAQYWYATRKGVEVNASPQGPVSTGPRCYRRETPPSVDDSR